MYLSFDLTGRPACLYCQLAGNTSILPCFGWIEKSNLGKFVSPPSSTVFKYAKMTTKPPSDDQIEVARVAMANCIKHSEKTDELDNFLENTKEVTHGWNIN